MHYLVHVENAQSVRTQLEFVLDQNPLVDLWVECLIAQYTSASLEYFFGTSSFTTVETVAAARTAVELSRNTLGLDPKLDVNELHLLFHRRCEDPTPGGLEWATLNRRIHHLEEQERNLLNNTRLKTGFNCVVVDAVTKGTQQRPISADLRSYWAHAPRSGELFLGYYTIGKTIYNCFKDQDHECVRQGMVRQQQQVSTEALCYWDKFGASSNSTWQQETNRARHQQIVNWLSQHGLENSIDLNLLENQYHGMPRLGEYAGPLTLEEINSALLGGKIVRTELVD